MSKFAHAIPQLAVTNVEETQRYYRDVLGFRIDWVWGQNDYGAVSRDDTVLYFSRADGPIAKCDLMIYTGQVDELCAEWKGRGAKILSEPEDKPWGLREFTMEDNNGHRFRIGEGSRVSPHVPREPAENVKYVHRPPTIAEYKTIIDGVGWTSFNNLEAAANALSHDLFSVVAEVDGQAVGMARVIGDGAQFFYVKDVAVLPDMQGRGLGEGMMNEIVEYFQNNAPEHALISLFTGPSCTTFYEQFGFRGPVESLTGMTAKKLRKTTSEA